MKLFDFFYAKYRGFAPLACLSSPRADIFQGFRRWKWLVDQRKNQRFVDPSVEIRSNVPVSSNLKMGRSAWIDKGCIVWMSDECGLDATISMGDGAYVGPYSYLGSCHQLEIGESTLIGAYSYLITVNHNTSQPRIPVAQQGFSGGNIKIGSNVWLGCHVVVLPNVTIGDGAIIGAGAVVNKDIPAGETWGGVPARCLRS